MKESLSSSETSFLTRTTRRNIPDDTILHCHLVVAPVTSAIVTEQGRHILPVVQNLSQGDDEQLFSVGDVSLLYIDPPLKIFSREGWGKFFLTSTLNRERIRLLILEKNILCCQFSFILQYWLFKKSCLGRWRCLVFLPTADRHGCELNRLSA
jgi:hypothetical protein